MQDANAEVDSDESGGGDGEPDANEHLGNHSFFRSAYELPYEEYGELMLARRLADKDSEESERYVEAENKQCQGIPVTNLVCGIITKWLTGNGKLAANLENESIGKVMNNHDMLLGFGFTLQGP